MTAERETNIVIRPAQDADRVMLLSFVRELNLYEAAFEANRRTDADFPEPTLDVRLAETAAKDGIILVAVDGTGALSGWIAGHIEAGNVYVHDDLRRYGYISELFVDPARRGQGVAAALVEAVVAHVRSRGVRRLLVGALVGNAGALAAYEALGFRPHAIELERVIA